MTERNFLPYAKSHEQKIILQAFNQKTMTLYDSYVTLQKILRGGFQSK